MLLFKKVADFFIYIKLFRPCGIWNYSENKNESHRISICPLQRIVNGRSEVKMNQGQNCLATFFRSWGIRVATVPKPFTFITYASSIMFLGEFEPDLN